MTRKRAANRGQTIAEVAEAESGASSPERKAAGKAVEKRVGKSQPKRKSRKSRATKGPGRETVMQQARRAAGVAHARMNEGKTWAEISAEFDRSVKQCQAIYADYLADQSEWLRTRNPDHVMVEFIGQMDVIIADMAKRARTAGENTPAAIGARRTQMQAMERVLDILQSAGYLPDDLAKLRTIREAHAVAQIVIDIFDKHGISEEIQDEVLERVTGQRADRPELTVVAGT